MTADDKNRIEEIRNTNAYDGQAIRDTQFLLDLLDEAHDALKEIVNEPCGHGCYALATKVLGE